MGIGRTGNIVITPVSGELINGNATLTITGSGCAVIEASPLGWGVISKLEPVSGDPVSGVTVTDFVVAVGDVVSVANGVVTSLEHAD